MTLPRLLTHLCWRQEAGDASQYASSQIVATSKPRELGSTGPDQPNGVNSIATKLANKATKQAAGTTPHSNGTANGVH